MKKIIRRVRIVKVRITEDNAVWASIDRPELINNYLSYNYVYWIQGRYRKERKVQQIKTMKGNRFYAGFIPKVTMYLKKKGYQVDFSSKVKVPVINPNPKLKGIRFRKDQDLAIKTILTECRGVWKAPTGAGKTLLIAAIAKALYPNPVLILVHTKVLLEQTIEELKRFFPEKDIGCIGKGKVDIRLITVAMRQTLVRRMHLVWKSNWECIIVDEAHHVTGFKTEYAKLLEWIPASIRVGFTATTYEEDSNQFFALEALIGPIIGETKYEELASGKVLAKPRLKFLRMPRRRYTKDYFSSYLDAIVNNRKRNLMIVEEAYRLIQTGRSVLIMVERLDHGEAILRLCDIKMPGVFVLLDGTTRPEVLTREMLAFKNKTRCGVVASRIWGEGLNIKSIGAVINAVGGKSEIASIQRFGRGLRKTKGKKDVILVDVIDTDHKILQEHSLYRICFYSEIGWI